MLDAQHSTHAGYPVPLDLLKGGRAGLLAGTQAPTLSEVFDHTLGDLEWGLSRWASSADQFESDKGPTLRIERLPVQGLPEAVAGAV